MYDIRHTTCDVKRRLRQRLRLSLLQTRTSISLEGAGGEKFTIYELRITIGFLSNYLSRKGAEDAEELNYSQNMPLRHSQGN